MLVFRVSAGESSAHSASSWAATDDVQHPPRPRPGRICPRKVTQWLVLTPLGSIPGSLKSVELE
jgi:hypothetical protein